jgi:hypothetical protein
MEGAAVFSWQYAVLACSHPLICSQIWRDVLHLGLSEPRAGIAVGALLALQKPAEKLVEDDFQQAMLLLRGRTLMY